MIKGKRHQALFIFIIILSILFFLFLRALLHERFEMQSAPN
jgi:hypothetical protein